MKKNGMVWKVNLMRVQDIPELSVYIRFQLMLLFFGPVTRYTDIRIFNAITHVEDRTCRARESTYEIRIH